MNQSAFFFVATILLAPLPSPAHNATTGEGFSEVWSTSYAKIVFGAVEGSNIRGTYESNSESEVLTLTSHQRLLWNSMTSGQRRGLERAVEEAQKSAFA